MEGLVFGFMKLLHSIILDKRLLFEEFESREGILSRYTVLWRWLIDAGQ